MLSIEILLVTLIAVAALCLLPGRSRQLALWLVASSIVVVILHAIIEGAHWQMIPAYVAIGVLCLAAWTPRRSRGTTIVASAALLLTATTVLLSFLLPMFRLPKPTGTFLTGETILYLKDPSRVEDAAPVAGSPRELMVQIWYPAQPSRKPLARYREPRETTLFSSYQSVIRTNSRVDAPVAVTGAPFPVILLNHGWRGRRTNDTFLAEELASHGYLVASIDHTYNAHLVAFPDGRIVHGNPPPDVDIPNISTAERVRAIWDKELLKQTADEKFVLDRLEAMNRSAGSPWFNRINTELAGAIGHSFGGAAATELCATDPRVRGSINMDGWFFGAIRARGANQPLMMISASDGQPPAVNLEAKPSVDAVLDATDYADMESSMHRFGGYLLAVKGAEHEDFTDQPLVSPLRALSHRGTVSAPEIQGIVRSYVLAFFDKTIRGEDPAILRSRSGPFAEASLEEWPEGKAEIASSAQLEAKSQVKTFAAR